MITGVITTKLKKAHNEFLFRDMNLIHHLLYGYTIQALFHWPSDSTSSARKVCSIMLPTGISDSDVCES